MRSTRKKIALGIFLLSVCILVWLDISAHARKNQFLRFLTQKGTVVLSPSVAEALLRDLKLGGEDRMRQWSNYFYMCAGSGSNLVIQSATVQDVFKFYISKEKPGRSNYFNQLIFLLKQQSTLSRKALLGYLGEPDFTSGGPDRQTLQYKYDYNGKDGVASAVVSNDVVVRIDVYVK